MGSWSLSSSVQLSRDDSGWMPGVHRHDRRGNSLQPASHCEEGRNPVQMNDHAMVVNNCQKAPTDIEAFIASVKQMSVVSWELTDPVFPSPSGRVGPPAS